MQFKILFSCFIVLYCIFSCVQAQTAEQDCRTLRDRCARCVRTLRDVTDETTLIRNLNEACRRRVAAQWIWRDLKRCDMTNIRCQALNRRITCALVAELSGMQRRR